MKKAILTLLICVVVILCAAQNDTITNVSVNQRTDGSGLVDVYFDLVGQGLAYDITLVEVSFDAGSNYEPILPVYLSGDTAGILPGDNLHIVWDGMATHPDIYSTQAKLKITAIEDCSCPPTVTDIDGNVYNTVMIGGQCWMKENLATTKYRNGMPINFPGNDSIAWYNDSTGAYAWYDNDISWKDIYGALYNGYVPINENNICPETWHVPTDDDYGMLSYYLGGIIFGDEFEFAGGKLKSTRTEPEAHPRWRIPNTGATNESNWTGLPGGVLSVNGRYIYAAMETEGTWWTRTASLFGNPTAYCFYMRYIKEYSKVLPLPKEMGLSIRCIWDGSIQVSKPTITTSSVIEITSISASCGGNITDSGSEDVIDRGIVWSRIIPTLKNNEGVTSDGDGIGEFVSYLTGLLPGTKYYVRAYATSGLGTAYGNPVEFTTDEESK